MNLVIPAQAGIQGIGSLRVVCHWIPAFAGMTAVTPIWAIDQPASSAGTQWLISAPPTTSQTNKIIASRIGLKPALRIADR